MKNLIVILFLLGILCANELNASGTEKKQLRKISDQDVIERISNETNQIWQNKLQVAFSEKTRFNSMQSEVRESRGWIRRHPTLFGTLLGFGAGFAIGISQGDGDDFSAEGLGLLYGGVGAGIGALIANIASD